MRPVSAKPQGEYAQGDTTSYQQAQPKQAAPQPAPKKEIQISTSTKERAEAAKGYIEKRYSKLKQEEEEKKVHWDLLKKEMDNLDLNPTEKELIKRDILHKDAERMRQKRKKISTKDFDPIAIIGRGAFGEVRLCRWKEMSEVVAMKKMNKAEMEKKNQIAHVRAERDILATAKNPWIVELKCSFQDDKYLYLVMEYLAGGDLMTLLMKKDILTEDEAKFYMAEAILAVDSVHKLNYIHRDLKPDNILLDYQGHIKLSDFGLCKHTDIRPKFEFKKMDDTQNVAFDVSNLTKKPQYKRSRKKVYTIVGTPDYIAPEVFGQKGYSETVDWWSLGTILFEMLVGYPPFFSDDSSITCQKIMHWKKTFKIPPEANLSIAATDLLQRLICDANERLGVNGVEEIKVHPFFAGIDWKRIRDKKAPYIPELKSDVDTSHFDHFDEEEPWYIEPAKNKGSRKNVNYIGYTFKRDFEVNERTSIREALEYLEMHKASSRKVAPKTTATESSDIPNARAIPGPRADVSGADGYGNGGTSTNFIQNLTQTSNSNMASALGSIAGSNYQSAQPKPPPTINTQSSMLAQSQMTNPAAPSNYGGDAYYSAANYSSARSPKANPPPKQNFFNIPGSREKMDPPTKPPTATTSTGKLGAGIGADSGVKKYVPFAASGTSSSVNKLQGPNMTSSSSKGLTSGLYKGK